jgi:hypothetical protein
MKTERKKSCSNDDDDCQKGKNHAVKMMMIVLAFNATFHDEDE